MPRVIVPQKRHLNTIGQMIAWPLVFVATERIQQGATAKRDSIFTRTFGIQLIIASAWMKQLGDGEGGRLICILDLIHPKPSKYAMRWKNSSHTLSKILFVLRILAYTRRCAN